MSGMPERAATIRECFDCLLYMASNSKPDEARIVREAAQDMLRELDLDTYTVEWRPLDEALSEAAALRKELADLEAANDAREREVGYGDGNLWRFWRDKAWRVVKKADEADALRKELEEAREFVEMVARVFVADTLHDDVPVYLYADGDRSANAVFRVADVRRARAFRDRGR